MPFRKQNMKFAILILVVSISGCVTLDPHKMPPLHLVAKQKAK
jgi:hypothetical protein